jgi:hypothetical protein
MAGPVAKSFAALCNSLKIKLESKKATQTDFLRSAGVIIPANASGPQIKELSASLAWVRTSLSNGADPDAWPNTLDAGMLATLLSLYPLPPHQHGATDSDLKRFAASVRFFAPPGSIIALPDNLPVQTNAQISGTFINTQRNDPPSVNTPPSTPQPSPVQQSVIIIPSNPTTPKRKAESMHNELALVLDPSIYRALDSSASYPLKERSRFLDMCKSAHAPSLLNGTTTAAFSHQYALTLLPGDFWDPPKRGQALTIAGRSAAQPGTEGTDLGDLINKSAAYKELREQWKEILLGFASDSELSGTHVDYLWAGITFIMQQRAARSNAWNSPEVSTACHKQLQDLPRYRAAIAAYVVQMATTSANTPARTINTAYLNFFLPFWWEHILGRARLDEADAAREAKLILPSANPTPAATPATTPAPPPPVYQLPPPPPVAYYPPPQGLVPHAAYPGPWLPAPAPPANSPGSKRPFAGKPTSPLVIGTTLGFTCAKPARKCHCPIATAFPGRDHFFYECPLLYHSVHGSCPGWTASGTRIPTCWVGDDITPACRASWKTFSAKLDSAHAAAGVVAPF